MTAYDASASEATSRKIMITGGSGFIGTNLVRYFSERGAEVLNFDKRPPADDENAAKWKQGEVGDLAGVTEAIKEFGPDYIVHLAARTDLNGASLEDYDDNFKGADNIIKAVNKLGGGRKRNVLSKEKQK